MRWLLCLLLCVTALWSCDSRTPSRTEKFESASCDYEYDIAGGFFNTFDGKDFIPTGITFNGIACVDKDDKRSFTVTAMDDDFKEVKAKGAWTGFKKFIAISPDKDILIGEVIGFSGLKTKEAAGMEFLRWIEFEK